MLQDFIKLVQLQNHTGNAILIKAFNIPVCVKVIKFYKTEWRYITSEGYAAYRKKLFIEMKYRVFLNWKVECSVVAA